jgi:hypothetical protein
LETHFCLLPFEAGDPVWCVIARTLPLRKQRVLQRAVRLRALPKPGEVKHHKVKVRWQLVAAVLGWELVAPCTAGFLGTPRRTFAVSNAAMH